MDEKDLKRFLINFFLVFIPLYVILLAWDPFFLREFVARSSAWLMNAAVTENAGIVSVVYRGEDYGIAGSCTGIVSISIFAGLVNSLKLKPIKKVGYALLSTPLFIALNVLRIAVSLYLGGGGPLTETLHFSLWIVSVWLILVLYILVVWKERGKGRERT
jgi:exosortase/archaeosortase family protein